MQLRPQQTRPAFLWQTVSILLPVVILAGIGFIAIRQDRRLAKQEAVVRAESMAQMYCTLIMQDLEPQQLPGIPVDWALQFQTSASGELRDPAPIDLPKPQAFNLSQLGPDQARLWREAQSAPQNGAARLWREFISTNPAQQYVAVALYSLGLVEQANSNYTEAAAAFQEVAENYSGVVGETGLPLVPLASLKLLELARAGEGPFTGDTAQGFGSVCSNLVTQPMALSGFFLKRLSSMAEEGGEQMVCQDWERTWERHQLLRELYDASRESITSALRSGTNQTSRCVWFKTAPIRSVNHLDQELFDTDWLAVIPPPTSTGRWVRCYSERWIGERLSEFVKIRPEMPMYFGAQLTIAGRPVEVGAPQVHAWAERPYMTKGGGGLRVELIDKSALEVLASSKQSIGAGDFAEVAIYLTNANALYSAQRTRSFYFALLVSASAITALGGLFMARRAFRRQLELNLLKSNFVSSVSHELRAPIASVRLMSENLASGKVNEEARMNQYFKLITQECRRLSGLIENVLDFSRIEQGRKTYELEPTDIPALVRTTIQLMEPQAEQHGVKLKMPDEISSALTPLLDGKAIQQALVNLIDNALKHSPRNSTVQIGVDYVPGGEQWNPRSPHGKSNAQSSANLLIWVEDQGEGIPESEHQRIFERFYRLGSELRRETTGVGIGLSIVKHIAESHGGTVQVRSAPGQGSRFTLVLPVENAATPERKL